MLRPVPLILGVALVAGVARAQTTANGLNAVEVEYRSADGRTIGRFTETGERQWLEVNGAGRNTFAESGRDDWSIYLTDQSRGVNIQLDLHTRKVMYSDRNVRGSELYQVTQGWARANGRNAMWISAADGSGNIVTHFRQQDGGWVEIGPQGNVTYRFREVGRDDWSVYLQDDSRNVQLQLDMHTRQVNYSQGGGPRGAIYRIAVARAR